MPLTLAHPAAVLPVARSLGTRAVLSALVIGSIAPDFAQLLQLPLPRSASHSIASIVYFSVPTGLATYLLFHGVMKRPILALLPDALRRRLDHGAVAVWLSHWGLVVISLAIGALTHIVWDSFTHVDAPVVASVPALRAHLFTVSGNEVFVFKVLQHGSTALGLFVLGRWIIAWYRGSEPSPLAAGSVMSRMRGLQSRCAFSRLQLPLQPSGPRTCFLPHCI